MGQFQKPGCSLGPQTVVQPIIYKSGNSLSWYCSYCTEKPWPLAAQEPLGMSLPSPPVVLLLSPAHTPVGSIQQTKEAAPTLPAGLHLWSITGQTPPFTAIEHQKTHSDGSTSFCNETVNTPGKELWRPARSCSRKRAPRSLQHCNDNGKENLTAMVCIYNRLFWQQLEQFTSLQFSPHSSWNCFSFFFIL